jgi:two-component system response regulator AlgR
MSIPTIFIVDDEAPARERLTTLLSDIQAECPHQLVGEASDAKSGLEKIAELRPDIILLDVQMPEMSGMEMAQYLRDHAVVSGCRRLFLSRPMMSLHSCFWCASSRLSP